MRILFRFSLFLICKNVVGNKWRKFWLCDENFGRWKCLQTKMFADENFCRRNFFTDKVYRDSHNFGNNYRMELILLTPSTVKFLLLFFKMPCGVWDFHLIKPEITEVTGSVFKPGEIFVTELFFLSYCVRNHKNHLDIHYYPDCPNPA